MTNAPTFGQRLTKARERRDMSADLLARRANINQTQISHYECGRREPSAGNLRSLALALDITSDYLLGLTNDTRRISPDIVPVPK